MGNKNYDTRCPGSRHPNPCVHDLISTDIVALESNQANMQSTLSNKLNEVAAQNSNLVHMNTVLTGTVAELRSEFAALSKSLNQLTHLYAKQEAINADLHNQIHELQAHCSGGDSGFHGGMESIHA